MPVSELFTPGPEDPYVRYERLRRAAPVTWDDAIGGWLVMSYDAVAAALRDPRLVCPPDPIAGDLHAVAEELDELYRFRSLFVLHREGEGHDRLRRALQRGMSARAARRLRPRIEVFVETLLDRIAPTGRMELMSDFALPLSTASVGAALGVPPRDLPSVTRWSASVVSAWIPTVPTVRAAHADLLRLTAYVDALAGARLASPRSDVVSDLAAARARGDLTAAEVVATVAFVCETGRHTTGHAIGNSVLALVESPETLHTLRDDPSAVEAAVEELLRFDIPGLTVGRRAREDLELAGVCVHAGDRVLPLLGSANRDPDRFPEPDAVRLDRDFVQHVAFGAGHHYCPGAPLARVELAVAVRALVTRLPGLHLVSGERPAEWRAHPAFRLLAGLSVEWDGGGTGEVSARMGSESPNGAR